MAKSLEKVPMITPGNYDGLWSAYFVQIKFENGKLSNKIALDEGIRGMNCACKVTVEEDGQVIVTG